MADPPGRLHHEFMGKFPAVLLAAAWFAACSPAFAGSASAAMTITVTIADACVLDYDRLRRRYGTRAGGGTVSPGPGFRCTDTAPENARLTREVTLVRSPTGRRVRQVVTTVDF